MNPIEEAIDAISSTAWADLLAQGANAIIIICMVYVGITQGKRLLRMAAGDYSQEEGLCANCGCELGQGAEWEEGFMCLECMNELGEPEDAMRAEGMSADEIDREMYPSAYADEACPYGYHADGTERTEAEHHEDYHEFLREADPQEAAAYAEEHGLVDEVEEATLQCPECGHENTHGDIYPDECCAECGHHFED